MDLTNASAIASPAALAASAPRAVRRLAQMGAKALTVRAKRSPTSENPLKAKFAELPFHALR